MRKVAAIACAGALAFTLAGCGGTTEPSADQDTQAQQEAAEQEAEEPEEQKTANVGEPVVYESKNGGDFYVTVDGLERSLEWERLEASNPYSEPIEGYWACVLLLTIEDESVETDGAEYHVLDRMWLEDSDGVTMSESSSGHGYGEYDAAPAGSFAITMGQTVRIAIPYYLPEGATEYTVSIDGVKVPVTLIEGSRPLA